MARKPKRDAVVSRLSAANAKLVAELADTKKRLDAATRRIAELSFAERLAALLDERIDERIAERVDSAVEDAVNNLSVYVR